MPGAGPGFKLTPCETNTHSAKFLPPSLAVKAQDFLALAHNRFLSASGIL